MYCQDFLLCSAYHSNIFPAFILSFQENNFIAEFANSQIPLNLDCFDNSYQILSQKVFEKSQIFLVIKRPRNRSGLTIFQ